MNELNPAPSKIKECVRKKLTQISEEGFFGEVTIQLELIKVDRVAVTIRSCSSQRYVLPVPAVVAWLDQAK